MSRLTAAIFALCLAIPTGASAAGSMALQPDGKIVLATEAWPAFGAVARLNSDGSLDESFGAGGTVVDRRMPPLKAVALQPDGRIVAVAGEGFKLTRYLDDGHPDSSFGEGRVAGTYDPQASAFAGAGPETVLVRPDGSIVVGGARPLSKYIIPQAIVRLYNADGSFAETVGFVPQSSVPPTISESWLKGLVAGANGSLVMAGGAFGSMTGANTLLARFVPGTGAPFDGSFGGGQGLVRPAFPEASGANAIVQDAGGLLVVGEADGTFMLARFDREGNVDKGFGNGGFANPPIEGTSGSYGSSHARAVAVQEDGRLVVAGDTSKWSEWSYQPKAGSSCKNCPEPLVTRYTPAGDFDPSFGVNGLVRLIAPNGGRLLGPAEQVAVLPDGKILVQGTALEPNSLLEAPFLFRLNADGTPDPSFGDGGFVRVQPPCLEKSLRVLRRQGCIPAARVRLAVGGLSGRRPFVSMRVTPSLPWARIGTVRLQLPRALRARPALAARARILAIGGEQGVEGTPFRGAEPEVEPEKVRFWGLGEPRELRAQLWHGFLRARGGFSAGRKLTFRVTVRFRYRRSRVGKQTVVLRLPG